MTDRYYDLMYKGSFWRSRGDQPLLQRSRIRRLRRVMTPGTVIDIGSGEAYFVTRARRTGLDVIGTDIRAQGLSAARRRSPECALARGDAVRLPFRSDVAAAVTMWDIIEHIEEPGPVLVEVERVLSNRGVLFLSTPNPAALSVRRRGDQSIQFTDPTHVSIHSVDHWTDLLGQVGLRVLVAGGDSWWDPPYGPRWTTPLVKVLSQTMFAISPMWPVSSAENTVILAQKP